MFRRASALCNSMVEWRSRGTGAVPKDSASVEAVMVARARASLARWAAASWSLVATAASSLA